MKPEHQSLVNLIKSMGMEAEANAGDFASIVSAANAESITTPRPDKVGGKESLAALINAGHDASAIVAAMRADPLGSEVMDTLITSGVDWNDDLTKVVLGTLVGQGGAITQAVADTLILLSINKTSPAANAGVPADKTALDFEIAWIVNTGLTTTQDNINTSKAVRDTSISDEKAILDAAQAAYNTAVSDADAIHSPVVAKHNAVSAWLQTFNGTTAAQWQARVDELIASPDGNVPE